MIFLRCPEATRVGFLCPGYTHFLLVIMGRHAKML